MSDVAASYPEPAATDDSLVSSNRGKILVAMVMLIASLGYFGFMAFQSATVYYYTVGELNDRGPSPEGKLVRVSGKLVPDSFSREDGSTVASFTLTDGAETMAAVHEGILPDLFFNEHSEIILEGTNNGDGVFDSQNVIVKCPSKYIASE